MTVIAAPTRPTTSAAAAPAFCRSCGQRGACTGAVFAGGAESPCPVCGADLCPPADERRSRIGRTFAWRAGLRTRTGVAVEDPGGVVVLLPVAGDVTVEVPTERLHDPGADPLGDLISPAYRLAVAARARPEVATLLLGRRRELLHSTAARRAYAACALERGDDQGLDDAGLSPLETAWLRLWHHHRTGSPAGILAELNRLPAGGYPDKLAVIAAGWNRLRAEPDGQRLVDAHLRGCAGDPLAEILLAAGDEPGWRPAGVPVPEAAAGLRFDPDATSHFEALLAATGAAGLDAAEAAASHDEAAALRFAVLAGRWARGTTPVRPAAVLAAGEGVSDDLIDAGLMGRELLELALAQRHPSAPYLRARLAPGELPDFELILHPFERARRAFLAGHPPDPGDPDLRALTLLHRLRGGDPGVLADLEALLPSHLQTVARAVARSLETGDIDPDALADTSTWEVLGPLAVASPGALPILRRLAAWWSVRRATEHLLAWDWQAAEAMAGDALAHLEASAGAETPGTPGPDTAAALAAEARNVAACAAWQAGDPERAAHLLATTPGNAPGTVRPALLVNLSLVAALAGDQTVAAEALGRLALEVDALPVRLDAARRALAVWYRGTGDRFSHAETGRPPDAVIGALRTISASIGRTQAAACGLFDCFDELMARLHEMADPTATSLPPPPLPVAASSPWLVLGLPFGTGTAEARLAFTRRARRVRRSEAPEPFTLSDLTWALHEVESHRGDPWSRLDCYRVPLQPPPERPGLFRPEPRPLPRRSLPPTGDDLDGLTRSALRRAAREVLASATTTGHPDPYPHQEGQAP